MIELTRRTLLPPIRAIRSPIASGGRPAVHGAIRNSAIEPGASRAARLEIAAIKDKDSGRIGSGKT